MKKSIFILSLSCIFVVQSQVQHIEGRLSVYPSGSSPENSFCGNIVVTKPLASGQYINLIRQGEYPWSIGMVYNTSNFAIGTGLNNDVSFNNPFFVINTLGNIGIGTINPGTKLTVSGDHYEAKIRLHSSGDGANQQANLSLWASEPGLSFCGTGIGYNVNGSPYYGRIDNTRGSSYLRLIPGETKFMFQKTSGETVDAMTINESGKIGIGTATPLAKLHINSGANNNYAAILATSNEGNNLVVSSHDTSPHSSVVFKIAHEYSNNPALRNNGYISFYRGSSDNGGFLEFGTSGLSRLRITPDGKVGIGTTNPQYALDVKGKIRGTEIRVEPVSAFPDYVFEKDYNLRDLKEVHDFINKNGHLPEIPTAQEVKENGIDLAEMQVKLLQKIEELTLYIIELENRITHLETK